MKASVYFSIPMLGVVILFSTVFGVGCNPQQDEQTSAIANNNPLPSWKDEAAKKQIIDFVHASVDSGKETYVPPTERIAVFDNDGTLWCEQPFYFQLAFAIDRIKAMAPDHPGWKQQEPFKSVLNGDVKKAMAGGEKALLQMVAASHSGMSGDEFEQLVKQWMDTARHPVTAKRYTEMIYQPMAELLGFLRENGYKTFIVSGGGIDFMRAWAEDVYGIPSEQIIGSSAKVKFEEKDGLPQITKLAELNFIDDGPGKPAGIYQHIGKRPIIAVGNSDGDYEMLRYTTASKANANLGVIIHHTDDVREYAYDSLSHIGRLKRGLTDVSKNNWLVVDMKKDWAIIFPD
jgi:phosphoglycolate phosphatase-like HAD superfamily hydrolase